MVLSSFDLMIIDMLLLCFKKDCLQMFLGYIDRFWIRVYNEFGF